MRWYVALAVVALVVGLVMWLFEPNGHDPLGRGWVALGAVVALVIVSTGLSRRGLPVDDRLRTSVALAFAIFGAMLAIAVAMLALGYLFLWFMTGESVV